ncbi:MAG TPA: GtrA family protein [Candidatus Saccharimonadales bacterium]|nr:GtrA family protein [Candidatus Saccharimonadales bacterium]
MIVRLFRFACVGVLCLLIQILILIFLERFIPPVLANMIGFLTSAQLNFILSYQVTWRDSPRTKGLAYVASWFKFNLVVFLSAALNAIVFYTISSTLVSLNINIPPETLSHAVAATGATIFSTTCTFLLNHYLVLKPQERGDTHGHTAGNGHVPARVERGS